MSGRPVLGVSLAVAFVAIAAHAEPIPNRIPSTTNPAYNTWLSAAAVAKGDKAILKTLATDAALLSAERTRAAFAASLAGKSYELVGPVDAPACVEFSLSTPPDRARASDTLADLTEGAQSIVAGSVTAIEQGFFNGAPTTLLRVSASEWIRRARAPAKTDSLLVPYPVARFHIKDGLFCGGTPTDAIPAPGDRVIIFVAPEAVTSYFPMLIVAPQEVIFAQPKGRLVLAGPLRHDPAMQAIDGFPSLIDVLRRGEKLR